MKPNALHATETVASDPAPALLIPDREAATMAGIGRATWHRLRAAGKIGPAPIRLGRAVRYRADEVRAWIEAGCPDARTWQAMRAAEKRYPRAV